jgi:hypothetical protein
MFEWLRDRSYVVPPLICLLALSGPMYFYGLRQSASGTEGSLAPPVQSVGSVIRPAVVRRAVAGRPAAAAPMPENIFRSARRRSRHVARHVVEQPVSPQATSITPSPGPYTEGVGSIYHFGTDPDPRDTVLNFVAALRDSDGDGMKTLVHGGNMGQRMDDVMKKVFEHYPQLKEVASVIVQKLQIDVGPSTIDGDEASVAIGISLIGTSGVKSALVELNWVDNQWKISDENSIVIAKAVQSVVMPLLMKTQVGQQIMRDLMSGKLDL